MAKQKSGLCLARRLLLVQLSSLGGLYRHARIHEKRSCGGYLTSTRPGPPPRLVVIEVAACAQGPAIADAGSWHAPHQARAGATACPWHVTWHVSERISTRQGEPRSTPLACAG